MKDFTEIFNYLPNNIANLINNSIANSVANSVSYSNNNTNFNNNLLLELQEIRIRSNRPIILKFRSCEIVIEYNVLENEILSILEKLVAPQ